MRLPTELVGISSIDEGFLANFRWRIAIERRVDTMTVVIIPELLQLSLQVTDIPENYVIKKLAA